MSLPEYKRPPRPADLEAKISYLPTEDGGRQGPVQSGYRAPQDFGPEEGWNDAQHEYPDDDWVHPGQTARALLWLLHPDLLKGRLEPGSEFTVHEGGRTVGHCRITQVLNKELKRDVKKRAR